MTDLSTILPKRIMIAITNTLVIDYRKIWISCLDFDGLLSDSGGKFCLVWIGYKLDLCTSYIRFSDMEKKQRLAVLHMKGSRFSAKLE